MLDQIFPCIIFLLKSIELGFWPKTVRFIVNFVAEMPLPPPGFVVTAGGPSGAVWRGMARYGAVQLAQHALWGPPRELSWLITFNYNN